MTNLVFVGGIHGVGKTTFCKPIVEATGYVHVTASQLIKDKNAAAINTNSKIVKDPDYNQKLLIEAVKERLASGQKLLLDGHFTVQTADGIQKLGVEIFRNLGVQMIAVLTDDPEHISARLLNRDGHPVSVNSVAGHQKLELDNAEAVANAMGVPLYKLTPHEDDSGFLRTQLQR